MTTLTSGDHVEAVRREGDALLATAAGCLPAAVPACPGWSAERLVGHVGRTWRWTSGWMADGTAPEVGRPPAGAPVVDWARDGLDDLVAALAGVDPAAPVPTWLGRRPAAFWPRRMAMETAVHRVDAQAAAGTVAPVDLRLALDGIEELLEVLLPSTGTGHLDRHGQSLHLHATDVDGGEGEWLVTLGPDALAVDRVHAKGDVAVRGPASDLFLLLWNRRGLDGLEVFGDRELLGEWQRHVRL
ncbi:MAG TPA: maleylpyruvate isomerase family mycothiol-dependent enzyme [Acidimicrobiales bacterium]|nr:maleylpyruvate isomerase family mycothiol-dependent enzyme [Acidimicrobiales bacterium]